MGKSIETEVEKRPGEVNWEEWGRWRAVVLSRVRGSESGRVEVVEGGRSEGE